MIIGIDLGTTNSLVAVWQDGKPVLIPNALGHRMTPSVVAVDKNNEVVVGLAARDMMLTRQEHAVAAFKRYMGTNKQILLGKRSFRPEELSALVLKSLKADAEAYLGEAVTEAIITVPAYFSDLQRKATRIAGQMAGMRVDRLLNEPTAAALAYGLNLKTDEHKFLVFDLGGGTFDISILELFDDVMEVRASAGDNYLGGEDWVDLMVAVFLREAGTPAGLKEKHVTPAIRATLRNQAELAKRQLSQSDKAEMKLVWKSKELVWSLSVDEFEKLSEGLLKRTRMPIERALRDARIRSTELDEIVLVGGTTRMPMIRRLVARMFGRLPSTHLNPDEVVALGAAVQAGLKARDASLKEVVVTDVCPFTLGIEISKPMVDGNYQSGFYQPIIERNSVIPISRQESFSPTQDNQRNVDIKIYQGESPMVKDNIYLESLHLPLSGGQASREVFDVRFTYDINGLLEVEAVLQSTGLKKSIVIEENPGAMSESEIKERLAQLQGLKIHPREQSENKAILARAERVYEENIGDIRKYIEKILHEFLLILERQDKLEVEAAREKLSEILESIDKNSYL
jgi:molecular chaperone HscC